MLRSKPADEVVENEEEAAAALVNVAKKTIVSQVCFLFSVFDRNLHHTLLNILQSAIY